MKFDVNITSEFLKSILDYDENSGFLIWKTRSPEMFFGKKYSKERSCATWNTRYAGKRAGSLDKDG